MKASNEVLVIGAGIAGMETALLLAEAGHRVCLLDEAPWIGGSMHLLDYTFPTDSCGLCFLEPYPSPAYCPTIMTHLHPLIRLLPNAEVEEVKGQAGDFLVTVLQKPRYVDPALCDGCGLCIEACPQKRPDPLWGWLYPTKAIYRPPLRAIPSAPLIDMAHCTRCGLCLQACPRGAINLEMKERRLNLEVASIVLAPGYEPFDAHLKGEYGYGIFPNVVTALQFERMLSFSGPTRGHLRRPSDGNEPRRIAFIQCVGSRDDSIGRGYCSSVCCMYTAKQASLAMERAPEAEVTIFYMDIRASGKGFERYRRRVASLPGVTYRRSMISGLFENPHTRNLRLVYQDEEGRFREEEFDLVVLAVGFGPPPGMDKLAGKLGLQLDEFGFLRLPPLEPNRTGREGIVVAGASREPKDIADTIVEAMAATALVCERLPASAIASPESPPERDLTQEEPRIGVFICRDEDVARTVDLEAVATCARGLEGVALVEEGDFYAAQGVAYIRRKVAEGRLNRLVIAGRSPRLQRLELEKSLAGEGLPPSVVEWVDLREECAWAHRDDPAGATEKARSLMRMAIARLGELTDRSLQAPVALPPPRGKSALVVGGGLAGMTAALTLAELGHHVHLVEREGELGGILRRIHYLLDGGEPQQLLHDLIARVKGHSRITLYLNSEVRGVAGSAGAFKVEVAGLQTSEGETLTLDVGAVILATGGEERRPTKYLYGQHAGVLTQLELEERLATGRWPEAGGDDPTVVMIQCVEQRDESRPYCSRICCAQALKNALRIKELAPRARIYVLYKDFNAFGFRETYYRRARELGVLFIRYEDQRPPIVEAVNGGLRVRLYEPVLERELILEPDLLVLSTGLMPRRDEALTGWLGLSRDEEGFLRGQNEKARPLDLAPGVYACGLAHSPRFIEEAIAQARAAAMKASLFLSRPSRPLSPPVTVNPRLCSACELCVLACPYGARVMDYEQRLSQVVEALCQGCGVCAMMCPNKATQQVALEPKAILAMIDAAL